MQWRRVSFEGREAHLSGEIVLPDGTGPHPAVVLLHGAGEGTRAYYRAHAVAFAEAGVGALIFDRRGEGKSTGARDMNLYTLAEDAAAAVGALRVTPLVDPGRVGLWGYSNGAWVATIAAETAQPACLVLAGASGVSPADSEVFRRTEDLRRQGIGGAALAAVERTWSILFGYMARGEWEPGWDAELASLAATIAADEAIVRRPISDLARANPQLDSVPRFDSALFADVKQRLKGASPDFGFDPIPALERLACPVLVVLAGDDPNVPVSLSRPRFEKLAAARPGDFDLRVLESADHLFSSEAYSARAAGQSLHGPRKAEDYRPDFLGMMADWLSRRA